METVKIPIEALIEPRQKKKIPKVEKKRITLEEQYEDQRLQKFVVEEKSGRSIYPTGYRKTLSIEKFRECYDKMESLKENNTVLEITESLIFRVIFKRDGGNIVFYMGEENNHQVQFLCNKKEYPGSFKSDNKRINEGDIIYGEGNPGRSKTGELSLYITRIERLAPCMKFIPAEFTDRKLRMESRWIDLNVNRENREFIKTRAKVFKFAREFLDDNDFIEVQTPIFDKSKGGGAAKPFITHHNSIDIDLYARVAPELRLKELVVGGLWKVYELGPQFRNEEADDTHNPEFYSLEFYQAFTEYRELMKFAEEMLRYIVGKTTGSQIVTWKLEKKSEDNDDVNNAQDDQDKDQDKVTTYDYQLDFSKPFKVVELMPELERITGTNFPKDLSSEEAGIVMKKICNKLRIETKNDNYSMMKKLAELVEDDQPCIKFVINHPTILSPLARQHDANPNITERFELFVPDMRDPENRSVEIANAFTELNDPYEQQRRFNEQKKLTAIGEDETIEGCDSYIDALKFGLPPTGGFGMGMERLVGVITGMLRIAETNTFTILHK